MRKVVLVDTSVPVLVIESVLPYSPADLWALHQSAEVIPKLNPPGTKVQVLSPPEELGVRVGAVHKLKMVKYGLPTVWHAEIVEVEAPHRFVDVARKSPFRSWRHEHAFLPHDEGVLLRDTIDYEMPLGPLGSLADALFVRRDLEQTFEHRHRITRELLTVT